MPLLLLLCCAGNALPAAVVVVLHVPSAWFIQPALRGGALKTLEAHDLVLNGPLHLVGSNFATIARIPIYIQNSTLGETFGSDRNCESPC